MNKAQRNAISSRAMFIVSPEAQMWRDRWSKLDKTLWDIWILLQDNQWYTAEAISLKIDKSPRYVVDIMRFCVKPWGLASSKSRYQSGYCLLDKNQPIII